MTMTLAGGVTEKELECIVEFCVMLLKENLSASPGPWFVEKGNIFSSTHLRVAEVIRSPDGQFIAGMRTVMPVVARYILSLLREMGNGNLTLGSTYDVAKELLKQGKLPDVG